MPYMFYCRPMAISQMQILNGNPLPAASGTGYSVQMLVVGGVPPYTWTLQAQSGPDTFALTSGGLLTLTATGGFTFGVSAFGTGSF